MSESKRTCENCKYVRFYNYELAEVLCEQRCIFLQRDQLDSGCSQHKFEGELDR